MPYVQDRVIHDADAHTMEPPEWLNEFAPKQVIEYFAEHFSKSSTELFADIERCRDLQADKDFRETAEQEIMSRKNFQAKGKIK